MQTDKIHLLSLECDPEQHYYLYRPSGEIRGVMASVHGVSLNADSHISLLAPTAKRLGLILVAPLFARERFPEYNLFGAEHQNSRGDLQFQRILAEVARVTGESTQRIFLCGYSAGGQFAHRYCLAYPEQIRAAVICSPGYYTFPTFDIPYPYGLQGMGETLGHPIDVDRFLSLPMLVNVGDQDVLRTPSLLQLESVDRSQGTTRLERATRWFQAVEELTKDRGIQADHRFLILRGVGHGFEVTMEKTSLDEYIFHFFQAHMDPSAM